MKTCGACAVEKPAGDYYRTTVGTKSLYRVCKECHKARTKAWHAANPETGRLNTWRNRGIEGMTSDEYQRLHDLQAGKCKICDRAEPASGRRLAVDHDHATGAVRGLLCTKCNTTVGWVELHPDLIAYLRDKESL